MMLLSSFHCIVQEGIKDVRKEVLAKGEPGARGVDSLGT